MTVAIDTSAPSVVDRGAAAVGPEALANATAGARRRGLVGWAALLVALVPVPLVFGELTTYRIGLVLIAGISALGLQVLVGWSRQISFAHAAVVGVPAFVAARLSGVNDLPFVAVVPIALLVGAAIGAVIGVPALRVRGLQVAVVTLLAGVAVDRFVFTKPWFADTTGISVPAVQAGPWPLFTNRSMFPLLLAVFAGALLLTVHLERSRLSRALKLVGASDELAESTGVAAGWYRVFAFAYAGALAGVAGAMQAYWVTRVGPASFGFSASLLALTIVVVGGPGSLVGPLVATALFVSRDVPSWAPPVALLGVVTLLPGGLNEVGRRAVGSLRRRRAR